MRVVIRYFFRTLRLILTPFVLLSEKLGGGKPMERSPEDQKEVDAACENLALYQFKTCPFCVKVRKQIARLNLNIEKRDAQHNETHRTELEQGGGNIKVPCLRIQNEDGSEQWMYDSSDINTWLEQRFGNPA
ncbi:glutaredoxin family protein [Marinobacter sediminicola]|uniref:glutaredoxin family protein n=1 Tax=Marinobacter sediminicola TaxID=3072994 RepID=UPI002810B89C|nr:glutathione S-transferase N-terminal domain-containing protein [Marinobacter sp. F26243]